MAGINALNVGRVSDGNNHHDWAVGIDRIATHHHNGTGSRLLAALSWIEARAENVTAYGFWKSGSLAAHVCLQIGRPPNHSSRTPWLGRLSCAGSRHRSPFLRMPHRSLLRLAAGPSPQSPAP